MSDPKHFAADFSYVRHTLPRPVGAPTAILILWAAVGVPGFALVDLARAAIPWYWLVAAPLAMIASILLARRATARRGEIERPSGLRWLWHWVGLLVAVVGFVLLAAAGLIPFHVLGPTIVLLLAVAYFLGGIHLDRRLLWVAATLAASFPVIALVPSFGWTASAAMLTIVLTGITLPWRRITRR